MPITRSAKKALRASLRKRQANLVRLERIHRLERQFRKAVGEVAQDTAKLLLSKLSQAYDKAAKRHVISSERAARKKHQAALVLNRMK